MSMSRPISSIGSLRRAIQIHNSLIVWNVRGLTLLVNLPLAAGTLAECSLHNPRLESREYFNIWESNPAILKPLIVLEGRSRGLDKTLAVISSSVTGTNSKRRSGTHGESQLLFPLLFP
jgi:hypothetical protein